MHNHMANERSCFLRCKPEAAGRVVPERDAISDRAGSPSVPKTSASKSMVGAVDAHPAPGLQMSSYYRRLSGVLLRFTVLRGGRQDLRLSNFFLLSENRNAKREKNVNKTRGAAPPT